MSGEQFEQFVKHCGVSFIHHGHGWWSSHGVHYACDGDGLPLGLSFPTGNTEQAITRTAEQSHLTALAERDALAAQVEALTAQRDEAVRLLQHASGPSHILAPKAQGEWLDRADALMRGVDQ